MKTGDLVRCIYKYGGEDNCRLYGKIGLVVASYRHGLYVDVLIEDKVQLFPCRRLEVISASR